MSDASTEQERLKASVRRLSAALVYQQELVSHSSKKELGATIVDQISRFVPNNKAFLFIGRRAKLISVSNISDFDRTSPSVFSLEKRVAKLMQREDAGSVRMFPRSELMDHQDSEVDFEIGENLLWVPLTLKSSSAIHGVLLLARDQPWTESDRLIMQPVGHSIAFVWHSSVPLLNRLRGQRYLLGILIISLLALFLPVTQTVLAPAQLVPADPFPVTAPLNGVIRNMHVAPYQSVNAGDLLLSFDATELTAERDVAANTLNIVKRELEALEQAAFLDEASKAQLAVWDAKLKEQQAVLDFTEFRLSQINVAAEVDGVAIFDDPEFWIGRPVESGQRVLLIADPGDMMVRIDLPVAELVPLSAGARVELFLDIAPGRAFPANLDYLGYSAVPTEQGVLAYRGIASLAAGSDSADLLRLGARGTAKLYGGRVSLAYYLFRKPWSKTRQLLGL